MKKTLLIALSLLISTYTFCQTPSSFDREEVVEVKNTKAKLYANAQTWIAKTFGDYKSVIQFEDKEQGRLIIKGLSRLDLDLYPDMKYVITVDVKEGKYRYAITDIKVGFGTNNIATSYDSADQIFERFKVVKNNLNKLTSLPTGDMSKKELKKHEEEINSLRNGYERNVIKSLKVQQTLDDISNSLKTAMKSNDDF
ncbi:MULTISPECIES: DUF4468 domain-containing protein [unclassified Arcicella]|uniref:DUF4468 domain-containing protein n=1 Tax=unclassified Arcicella TaxID=2644986 RepID=UPI00285838DC|nr:MULTISPECIES: DUF4468 domain-containing protein [unclassified Arcicella]MDR6564682.1 hypothetical protein [Arcicella sp. BE51]MDR6814391.1 hypothetical protein [Arcicella sp. BE140]MDR6825855.1 hypothetical protein [Arcicella sp. BE139]